MLKYYNNDHTIIPRLAKSFYCWDKYINLFSHHYNKNETPIQINNIFILPLFILNIIKNITHEDIKITQKFYPRYSNNYYDVGICTILIALNNQNKNTNIKKLTFVYNNMLFSFLAKFHDNSLIVSLCLPYHFSESENTLFSIPQQILNLC